MTAKERHRCKLLEYLSNPENDMPNRVYMNDVVLGFHKSKRYIYVVFTVDELNEIESEALEIRRKKYKPAIAKADKALLAEAEAGNVQAIKLAYQRFEDWSEKQRKEVTKKLDNESDEELDNRIKSLIGQINDQSET